MMDMFPVVLIYAVGALGVGFMTGGLLNHEIGNVAAGVGLLAWSALTLLFVITMREVRR